MTATTISNINAQGFSTLSVRPSADKLALPDVGKVNKNTITVDNSEKIVLTSLPHVNGNYFVKDAVDTGNLLSLADQNKLETQLKSALSKASANQDVSSNPAVSANQGTSQGSNQSNPLVFHSTGLVNAFVVDYSNLQNELVPVAVEVASKQVEYGMDLGVSSLATLQNGFDLSLDKTKDSIANQKMAAGMELGMAVGTAIIGVTDTAIQTKSLNDFQNNGQQQLDAMSKQQAIEGKIAGLSQAVNGVPEFTPEQLAKLKEYAGVDYKPDAAITQVTSYRDQLSNVLASDEPVRTKLATYIAHEDTNDTIGTAKTRATELMTEYNTAKQSSENEVVYANYIMSLHKDNPFPDNAPDLVEAKKILGGIPTMQNIADHIKGTNPALDGLEGTPEYKAASQKLLDLQEFKQLSKVDEKTGSSEILKSQTAQLNSLRKQADNDSEVSRMKSQRSASILGTARQTTQGVFNFVSTTANANAALDRTEAENLRQTGVTLSQSTQGAADANKTGASKNIENVLAAVSSAKETQAQAVAVSR